MNKTTEALKLAKEAGFEVVDGELRLYFDGSNALLKPNRMGTVVDGLKEFATLVRAEREWVELTDDEIHELVLTWEAHALVRAVITAFKDKNK